MHNLVWFKKEKELKIWMATELHYVKSGGKDLQSRYKFHEL